MAEDRFARGGVVHGPGEGVPIRFDPTNEYLMTAAQASARAREALQAVKDAMESAAEKGQAYRDHMRIPDELLRQSNRCLNCGQPIQVMINRGTGWCSEQCRKALANE
jgi:hypothetical protein